MKGGFAPAAPNGNKSVNKKGGTIRCGAAENGGCPNGGCKWTLKNSMKLKNIFCPNRSSKWK